MNTGLATAGHALPVTPPAIGTVDVEIVIPVYDEERCLPVAMRRLVDFLPTLPYSWLITIVDNASTDDTYAVATRLADEHDRVRVVHLGDKGRGRALRTAWSRSDAAVVAYMDVDLSTDLEAMAPLIAPLLSGHSDVAIGTRLARGSQVIRGRKREFVSRSYNLLLRTLLRVGFSDAQCGFKAVRTDRVRELLPLIEDEEWFFDTELLTIAERAGLRIHEVPVDWVDDPDSSVDVVATARADVRGIARLVRGFARGTIPLDEITARRPVVTVVGEDQRLLHSLVRFVAVGIASTVLFALLFLAFREFAPALTANVAALLLATAANTAVNRRFTFGVRGREGALRHQLQGFVILGIALLITSGSLLLLHAVAVDPGRWTELAVVTVANLIATIVRFLLFRSWVFTRKEVQSP